MASLAVNSSGGLSVPPAHSETDFSFDILAVTGSFWDAQCLIAGASAQSPIELMSF
jgi:hypothetical protein